MGYEFISDPAQAVDAFALFKQVLGVTVPDRRVVHQDYGFWADREYPDRTPEGPRDAVVLCVIGSVRGARVTVQPNSPLNVAGLLVVDESGRRYITHSGRLFDGYSSDLQDDTKSGSWISVTNDKVGRRYLITPLDEIDDTDVLKNVSHFVQALFPTSEEKASERFALRPEGQLASAPLNRVLFGPPGTGKTFDAVTETVKTIDGHVPTARSEVRSRFNELKRHGRVDFVTFHQNYTYEDFIEGIRPALEKTQSELRYELRDGVFKQIAT